MQKMRLRPGIRPGPHWGAYDAPPDSLVGWGGDTSPQTSPPPSLGAFGTSTLAPPALGFVPLHIISGYATEHGAFFVSTRHLALFNSLSVNFLLNHC